jgi:hypothetical protein
MTRRDLGIWMDYIGGLESGGIFYMHLAGGCIYGWRIGVI